MKKTPSKNMQAMYDAKRSETLQKISDAIREIEDDHRIVTKKELISLTGLSSGTFSKPYVLELLKEKKVCQFRDKRVVLSEKKDKLSIEVISDLSKENDKLKSQIEKLDLQISKLSKRLSEKESDYAELKKDYELLKGRYQILLEKLDILGEKLDPKLYN